MINNSIFIKIILYERGFYPDALHVTDAKRKPIAFHYDNLTSMQIDLKRTILNKEEWSHKFHIINFDQCYQDKN